MVLSVVLRQRKEHDGQLADRRETVNRRDSRQRAARLGDISWIFGLIVAAGLYYVLMRGEVAKQPARTPASTAAG
jgi:cytosine/uracil/thiamine/allantoin permease